MRSNCQHLLDHSKSKRVPEKNIYLCFIDYAKAFDCVDHNKLWKIFQEMGIPDHLTCLLRNLYAGQETTVRTGHGTTAAAAATKLLRSCLTLCDLIDSIPPDFSVHKIPQARTLEWVTISFSREQLTGSKLGKEYIKVVYCHPAYLICMQSTS